MIYYSFFRWFLRDAPKTTDILERAWIDLISDLRSSLHIKLKNGAYIQIRFGTTAAQS